MLYKCSHCKELLEVDLAFWRRQGGQGRIIQPCRACTRLKPRDRDPEKRKIQTKRYREQWPEKVREIARRARQRKPEVYSANAKRWTLKNKERLSVRSIAGGITYRAIKNGILIRPDTCSDCGGPGFIEAAHGDYSRPLDVRWLCRSCHRKWDKAEPKTKLPADGLRDALVEWRRQYKAALGPRKPAPGERERRSAAQRGRLVSTETCAKMSLARKGRPLSARASASRPTNLSTQHKDSISKTLTGKKRIFSAEHCAAISAAKRRVN